nr:formyl transferase [Candidatus Aenigmarchaeota archaeon]
HTHSPNTPETEHFIKRLEPDIMIVRCKFLLKKHIFSIPNRGTFVFHPGVCPEYRNAHGCFWALVNRDLDKVGMTLLKIDEGIDTGPVYGYFTYQYDEEKESHIVIQNRVVFDNLDRLKKKLVEVHYGSANPIDTSGRKSGTWGQPWLTSYLAWKSRARKRNLAL